MKFAMLGIVLAIFLNLVSTQTIREPPTRNGPVNVSIGIHVQRFQEINLKRMDYTLSMFFRESWTDSRVSHHSNSSVVHRHDTKKFWFPDIFLRNEKFTSTHNALTGNRLLRISPEGNVWHVRRITSTLSCPMNFIRFPFDVQTCPMVFESFAYMTDTLVLSWMNHPVEFMGTAALPYTLVDTSLRDCSHSYSIGTFPCLEIHFTLKRNLITSIIEFFLPTIFLVFVAWMTFWIDLKSTTHRIVISTGALFLICFLNGNIKENLPTLNYFTTADLWSIICFVHVLYIIIVHIIVYVMLNTAHNPQKLYSDSCEKVILENPEKSHKKEVLISAVKNLFLGEGLLRVTDADKCKRSMSLFNAFSRIVVFLHFLFIIITYFSLNTSMPTS